MIISPAGQQDLSKIVELTSQLLIMHQIIDPEYYRYEEDYTGKIKTWAEQQLSSDNSFLFIAREKQGEDEKITGYISGYVKYLFPWYKIKSVGHISFLAVDPAFQKRGIGKMLNEEAEKWFKLRNLKYIEVFTNEKNSAGQAAWKAYGFAPFNSFLRKTLEPG